MRTNIVLDEALVKEAQRLTHLRSMRDVVHLALQELVSARRQQLIPRETFFATYIEHPIQVPDFKPMPRDEIYDR